jgi:predicted amidohydrolase
VIDQCYAEPGQQSAVISFAGQEFGLMTCMDANYYEYFAEYRNNAVDSILISMDWDQNPHSASRAASRFFTPNAQNLIMNIYASDVSKWDGTALYYANGRPRSRPGLSSSAIGVNGFTVVTVPEVDL